MSSSSSSLSTTHSLGVIIATSTMGSGHFENTMLVMERFLIKVQWPSTNIWLIFEEAGDETYEEKMVNEVSRRLKDSFLDKKIPCIPSVSAWDNESEISTEDLLVLTGGLDISSVQPAYGSIDYMWNNRVVPPNTKYLLQCQPLWWAGEGEKWQGSDKNDGLTYVNGAQSGLWQAEGPLIYDEDGDLETRNITQVQTPLALPPYLIHPINYQQLLAKRLSRTLPGAFRILMYGSFPAGNEYKEKQFKIYENILKSLTYITTKEHDIEFTRIADEKTLEDEDKINKKYASDSLVITPRERLPKEAFLDLLCQADLVMSEGQNTENQCLCLHTPVFQWRSPIDRNNEYNFVSGTYQNCEIEVRKLLNEGAIDSEGMSDENVEKCGNNLLAMILNGLGPYPPQIEENDKLTLLLDTLYTTLADND